MKARIGIAGAGFAGAVVARELAASGKFEVVVYDERPHVAGNCFTERDAATGVMIHKYGPHIFHTSREDVWKYVNRFGEFSPYTNRVKAVTKAGVFSLPINLLTINQFFGKALTPETAKAFIATLADKTIREPQNLEEQALKFMGRELYENFFAGYTKKQWGVDPKELPASILQRLPMRFNYDDNYYPSRYQGIPTLGYTPMVANLLDHDAIDVRLGEKLTREEKDDFDHVFFSGPMDAYFGFSRGRMQYRTLDFERFEATGDFQGNPVINYCEERVPYTRITEHKHFLPHEEHAKSVCFREFSRLAKADDIPYYPLRLADDKALLEEYVAMAEAEAGVTFIGRLGSYRYLDMHVVIGESLDLAKTCLSSEMEAWPCFSGAPLPGVTGKRTAVAAA